jgi:hypothetical protein
VKIHQNFVDLHKILLKFTKIRMDFQLTNFFGEFYVIFSLSAVTPNHVDVIQSRYLDPRSNPLISIDVDDTIVQASGTEKSVVDGC